MKEKRKVKFPCKLCTDDHLTHLCPKLMEVARLLNLPPVVLTNPFPHNHHLASSSSKAGNVSDGSQNPLSQDGDHVCINIVDVKIDIATHSRDYSSSKSSTSLEAPPPPPKMNLQIEKLEPPRTILLLKIWAKPLVRCRLWRYSRCVHHRGMTYSLP